MIKELVLAASLSAAQDHLTEAIYHEARGEGRCQYYVAGVIKNRMISDRFPDTIQGVIEQPHQFSYKSNPDLTMHEKDAVVYAEKVAEAILTSEDVPSFGNILYFHTTTSNPSWASSMEEAVRCGSHIFYTED